MFVARSPSCNDHFMKVRVVKRGANSITGQIVDVKVASTTGEPSYHGNVLDENRPRHFVSVFQADSHHHVRLFPNEIFWYIISNELLVLRAYCS